MCWYPNRFRLDGIDEESPPHMRGTVLAAVAFMGPKGITPAHAGNRTAPSVPSPPLWDHPRTCGEQNTKERKRSRVLGSPPHMRGTGLFIHGATCLLGITPAHARNRRSPDLSARQLQDHPRTCGEQQPRYRAGGRAVGSPPHMRGTGIKPIIYKNGHRITPAHAGNSRFPCTSR